MKLLVIVPALALALLVPRFAHAQEAASIERGLKVYTDTKCSICHAIGGKGNAKGPLDDIGTRLTAEEIREWIVDAPAMSAAHKAERKPAMKAYTLPKDDLDALVAYLGSMKDTKKK